MKIAVVQFNPVIARMDINIDKHLEYIKKAKAEGCSLIVFPELSLTGYALGDAVSDMAIPPDDECLKPLLEAGADISICLGAVELSPEYFIYNSSFFIEDGRVSNVYRKIYPPTYGVFDEKRFFAQGRKIEAFDTKLGRFGCMICNDARHPILPHILAMDGCKYMIIQSAVPVRGFPKGEKHLPAVYFENGNKHYAAVYGMYVIFANLAGHVEGLLFGGDSMIAAPGGDIIAQAPLFEEAMITAELSEDVIRRYRISVPILNEENLDLSIDEMIRIKESIRRK